MTALDLKKKAVLNKFYGGEREIGDHDFRLRDGKCKNCGVFIGDAKMRLCSIIMPEEVVRFRMEDL